MAHPTNRPQLDIQDHVRQIRADNASRRQSALQRATLQQIKDAIDLRTRVDLSEVCVEDLKAELERRGN